MTVILSLVRSDLTSNCARAEATGANSDGLGSAVDDSLYLTNIGLPGSVGVTIRVGNALSENNALSANFTLCHVSITKPFLIFSKSLSASKHKTDVTHTVFPKRYAS